MPYSKPLLALAVPAAAVTAALAPAVAGQAAVAPAVARQAAVAPAAASRAALPAYVLEDYYINSADCNSVGSRMKAAHQITAYYCKYVPGNGVGLYVQY